MEKSLLFCFLLIVITPECLKSQSPVLWGTTQGGGQFYNGTLFSYATSTGVMTVRHSFGDSMASSLEFGVIKASNGYIYGVTGNGGLHHKGVIYSYHPRSATFAVVYNFGGSSDSDAAYPAGSVIQASNGILYGMTNGGGTAGSGTIYSYNIATATETVLHSFGYGSDGYQPMGSLIQANNNLLYGTTNGSADDAGNGTIFSYDISTGQEHVLYSFGAPIDGTNPEAALIQAKNDLLYGMTPSGGNFGGVIFSYNISAAQESALYSFSDQSGGWSPLGPIMQANNGLLYGLLYDGSLNSNSHGTFISFDINTGNESLLHDFAGDTDGMYPVGVPVQASDGALYGETYSGGANGNGLIFKYDITTGAILNVHDFEGVEGINPTGFLIEDDDSVISGIQQLNVYNELSVSPNPSNGLFTIGITGNQNNVPFEVFNMMGENVQQFVLTNNTRILDLSRQPPGLYFLYGKSEGTIFTTKVLITK